MVVTHRKQTRVTNLLLVELGYFCFRLFFVDSRQAEVLGGFRRMSVCVTETKFRRAHALLDFLLHSHIRRPKYCQPSWRCKREREGGQPQVGRVLSAPELPSLALSLSLSLPASNALGTESAWAQLLWVVTVRILGEPARLSVGNQQDYLQARHTHQSREIKQNINVYLPK